MRKKGHNVDTTNGIKRIKDYILLYCAFLIYSVTSIFAKMAAMQSLSSIYFYVYIALEVLFLGFYAILWQQALKRFKLVTAMSSKGIVVIFSLFWSVFLFKETVTINNILGAMLIICGIWVGSKDE